MHLVSIKQHHKTHLITDIFVTKITKEVFIGIGARYKNVRGHEMSKNLNTGLIINTAWLLEILLHFPLKMGLKLTKNNTNFALVYEITPVEKIASSEMHKHSLT